MSQPHKVPSAPSKEENVYIPSFIKKRPFYAALGDDDSTDYLEHQRLHNKSATDSAAYERGRKAGPAATKWRKGACENCGAMGHKAKDCLERPRKVGARWTGKDIQADRVVKDVELSWAAKRDQYNGYDPREYRKHVEEFEQMEELRKQTLARKAAESGESGETQEDGDRYAEEIDMSKHQPTSTRQLRLREDTAKYLLNLDLESAKYDPKTRSIVDAGAAHDKAAELFAEEGYMRASGDAAEFEKATRYAWEAQEKKGDTSQHLQANPTAGEFYRKKEREEAERKKAERERELREKYGVDQQTIPAALKDMTVTESETFVEYDEAGLIKGAPKSAARSKYPEDVFTNNHTSVWGSWWFNFQWGYACCHSFIKNSYCTGEEGKLAWEAAERRRAGADLIEEPADELEREEEPVKETKDKKAQARPSGELMDGVSEAELDAYRRKRTDANDPMAKFLGKDELV